MHFPFEEQVRFGAGAKTFGKGPIAITQWYWSPYPRLRRGIKRVLGHQPPASYPIAEEQIGELLARNGLRETKRLRLNSIVSEAIFTVAVPKYRSLLGFSYVRLNLRSGSKDPDRYLTTGIVTPFSDAFFRIAASAALLPVELYNATNST
jgi:hypothetical protein